MKIIKLFYVWVVPALALWLLAISILSIVSSSFHNWMWGKVNPDMNAMLFISILMFFAAMFVSTFVRKLT